MNVLEQIAALNLLIDKEGDKDNLEHLQKHKAYIVGLLPTEDSRAKSKAPSDVAQEAKERRRKRLSVELNLAPESVTDEMMEALS